MSQTDLVPVHSSAKTWHWPGPFGGVFYPIDDSAFFYSVAFKVSASGALAIEILREDQGTDPTNAFEWVVDFKSIEGILGVDGFAWNTMVAKGVSTSVQSVQQAELSAVLQRHVRHRRT
jgi:hypothetical protein